MSVLFIGKRFYTNRDALREKYGRIFQLPWQWSSTGIPTKLWLIDYHSRSTVRDEEGSLDILSSPVRNFALFRHWLSGSHVGSSRPDLVVASGDCYIGWLGWRVARKLKARFVFDVYDKYDEFGAYYSPPGFSLFAKLLDVASVRLFASRALMESLSRSRLDCLVPNGIDAQRFRHRDMHESRAAMGLPETEGLVGYFGGMEPDRGVSDLIDAVELLRGHGLKLRLVLGGKPAPGVNLDAPGIVYLGNVPYDRMPSALAACDVLAVPYRRSPFMDAGSSNKIAEAIACARPVVATRTPNLLSNFPAQAEQLGPLLAEPGDVADIARSIRQQFEQRLLVDLPAGFSWPDIASNLASRLALHDNAAEHPRASST